MFRSAAMVALAVLALFPGRPARAEILWSDLGATLVHESGAGSDILGSALKRGDSAADALYFKFHVDLLSDTSTEEYFAGFQLFEGNEERLGVGNSLKAWAYSAFNTAGIGESNKVFGDFDLHSARPESAGLNAFYNYELPRRGIESTIVFKVQFMPDGDDRVTVWLNPDLATGATEETQTAALTTHFKANASFNEIRLRHGGGGGGWTFSDMAIATAFSDFVTAPNLEANDALRLTFQTWQREQGLPQNSVRALAQTRDGYLWIGNDDGLARFDGVRFVAFGIGEGLASGPVSKLLGDSRGDLWIGTVGNGLIRHHDGLFTAYTIHDGLPSDSITAFAEDNDGRVWIGTENGLVVFENGRLTPLAAAGEFQGKAITALFRDRRETLWLGVRGAGVFHFLGGRFIPVTDPSVDDLLKDTHCLLVDQSVRVWIGAGDDFVLCREGDQWHRYRIPRHLTRPLVSALAEDAEGTVWAGSVSEGLFQFKDGKLKTFTANNGLADNYVGSLLVDRENNLWAGTGAGLSRLRRGDLSVLGQSEGLGYGAVHGLAEISPELIWAGKPGDGLYQWNGRRFNRLDADLSRRYPEVNSLLVARDGSCWAACSQGLLHFKNPQSDAGELEQPALADANVISLLEDHDGGIWAGTREGQLWRRRAGVWQAETNFIQPHAVSSLAQAKDGALWIGTEGGGLYEFNDAVVQHFGQRGRLLSNLIRTLYYDPEGTLWIGTAGGGLSRWRDGQMTVITIHEGLPDNTVSQILEDDDGRLWLGSNRGIVSVRKRELEKLAAGKITRVYPRVYGRLEGMLSEECTGGFAPAGLKTKSGLLWFSTLKGIAVVNPRLNATIAPAPKVVLEEVLVDGVSSLDQPQQHSASDPTVPREGKPETLQIPAGKYHLDFRFTAPTFTTPEMVRFRYRIEGLDADWVEPKEAGKSRTASYTYVPPGVYRFRVMACDREGVWSDGGAEISLHVLPHFWQSWWFIGLASLGVVALIGSAFRYAEKRKHQRRLAQLEQEHVVERERSRIAQDLHDDLGSSLARISLLSGLVRADKDNPAQVETHAAKIFQSADQTVRALEEIVWAVRPGSDTLQSLVEYIAHFANELFDGNQTRCRLDLAHDLPALALPPDVRHNIFLIVKEALTNALKHAAAREVRVAAKADGSTIEIVVADDGKGIAPAPAPAAGKGHGLGNMRQRAETIGGKLDIHRTPGEGTTVRLTVNLSGDNHHRPA